MKNYIASVILGLIFTTSFAQNNRNLSPFDEVKVATGVRVTLVSGNAHKAEIEVENCSVDEVITEVRGDRLLIKFSDQRGSWGKHRNRKAHVTLTYRDLSGLSVSSGGMIKSQNKISSDNLEIDGSSGGHMEIDVSTTSASIDVSSGSVIKLTGEAKRIDVDASSGGVFNGYDFETSSCVADASSGGVVKVNVLDNLRADASSGGSVNYKGNPEKLDLDKSISGSIRARS